VVELVQLSALFICHERELEHNSTEFSSFYHYVTHNITVFMSFAMCNYKYRLNWR